MHDLRLRPCCASRAARVALRRSRRALAYTQPAVSQQIARLEKQVGVKLIEREPADPPHPRRRGARPPHRAHPRPARRRRRGAAGGRRHGARAPADRLVRHRGRHDRAARAVAAFRRLRPAIEVDIALLDPHESIPAVRRGDIEIAITEEGGFDGRGRHERARGRAPARRPHVGLAAGRPPARHPPRDRARRAARRGLDVRLPERHLRDSNVVLRACQDAGFQPRIAYQSDDYFAIQGLVASGMGVALIPGLGLASTREDVAVRPVKGRPPYRRVAADHRRRSHRRRDPDDARVPARRRRGLRRVRARRGRLRHV